MTYCFCFVQSLEEKKPCHNSKFEEIWKKIAIFLNSEVSFQKLVERQADRNNLMTERIACRRARKSGIGSKEPLVEQHSLLPPSSMR
jgi:hypothetical protein